ncbi:MAG: sigma-70 family RNA polymerase sigma factor [Solirubrobacterales bacterium]
MSTSDYESTLTVEREGIQYESGQRSIEEDGDDRLIRSAIAKARRGQIDALRMLYVCYSADVLITIKGVIKDSHEAEDIAQDVFIKLISVIDQYTAREGIPFAAWIRRVARNCAYDHLRSRQAAPCEEIELHSEHGQIEHERRRDICSAFASLPSEQRSVMVLRHIRGLSPLEIAGLMGKSESSIHGLHHRGRVNLRKSLAKLGAGPVVSRPGR